MTDIADLATTRRLSDVNIELRSACCADKHILVVCHCCGLRLANANANAIESRERSATMWTEKQHETCERSLYDWIGSLLLDRSHIDLAIREHITACIQSQD